jgi:hypothetical protein
MQDCAHEGTADTAEAQFGAAVTVTHDDDPVADVLVVAGALVVVEELLGGALLVEDVVGVLLDLLTGALVEVVGGAVGDTTSQVVIVLPGPLAQTQTALAEASTAPKDAAGHPAITQGPAVA